MSYT
ncbi:TPA_asm: UL30.5 sORF RNA |jgi:hypothetical protein